MNLSKESKNAISNILSTLAIEPNELNARLVCSLLKIAWMEGRVNAFEQMLVEDASIAQSSKSYPMHYD